MPTRNMPSHFNIAVECLEKHALGQATSKTAMIFVRSDLSHEAFTYGQLHSLARRFATSLAARGLDAGDRVLLRLPNSVEFPIAFFGAIYGGFIPVPSSPMLTGSELGYLLTNSGAAALVSDRDLMARVSGQDLPTLKAFYLAGKSAGPGQIALAGELENSTPMNEAYRSGPGDAAYLVYTSGTTGYPKGVLHAQQALSGRTSAASHWFNFKPGSDDRILHSGKFNWTYVLGTAMMDPLYQGKTVVVYEGENSPARWLELIRNFECNTFIGVPTIFRQILQKTDASCKDTPTLQHAMCAGEHLTDEVLSAWTQRFGFPIYEGLGMSECSYYISQRPGEKIKANSAGRIQPGRKIEILDENLEPVKDGEEGMLCIHRDDPGLFLEYWQAPEANAAQFRSNWFLTGDYAVRDHEGYIFFLGRRDEIIKSFGYRISPLEIERVYRDHEAIEDVVAFAEVAGPEKTLVSLCVQLRPGHQIVLDSLLEWGKTRLASYKLPRKVYQLDKFPRSANGKVLRRQIPITLGLPA